MSPDQRFGFMSGLGAYFMWGLLPLYLKLLDHIAPTDILAHRVVWSVPTGALLLIVAGRFHETFAMLLRPSTLWLVLSSALIAGNWLTYIWAVTNDRIIEASLGYFLNPLVNVAIGAVFLSEKLRRLQWFAVSIAAIAVIVETIALGRLPWVSLILCFSFATYGYIRRQVQVDGRVGLTLEVLFLLPVALIWLAIVAQQGGSLIGGSIPNLLMLMLAGPATAFPLILFALAAKRLKFSTIGIMQYLGPTMQFLLALAFGETLTSLRLVTFSLILVAVILFSLDAYGHDRHLRRSALRPT